MRSVVEKAYRYRSEAELLHPPEDYTFVSVSESIQLLNELYSSSKGEELGIKPKYIEGLKNHFNLILIVGRVIMQHLSISIIICGGRQIQMPR